MPSHDNKYHIDNLMNTLVEYGLINKNEVSNKTYITYGVYIYLLAIFLLPLTESFEYLKEYLIDAITESEYKIFKTLTYSRAIADIINFPTNLERIRKMIIEEYGEFDFEMSSFTSTGQYTSIILRFIQDPYYHYSMEQLYGRSDIYKPLLNKLKNELENANKEDYENIILKIFDELNI